MAFNFGTPSSQNQTTGFSFGSTPQSTPGNTQIDHSDLKICHKNDVM